MELTEINGPHFEVVVVVYVLFYDDAINPDLCNAEQRLSSEKRCKFCVRNRSCPNACTLTEFDCRD